MVKGSVNRQKPVTSRQQKMKAAYRKGGRLFCMVWRLDLPFKMFDNVRLVKELPDLPLTTDNIGVVLEVYTQPKLAYEVEFSDENGQTIVWQAFEAEQLQPA